MTAEAARDPPRHEPRRRPDRRRRHLRHRRRLAPAGQAAGQDLRDPRGARRDRRHLGPVPLPGHPLGLGPAHVRLRLQAVDRARSRSPTATSIRGYIRETAEENGIDRHIRFGHKAVARRVVERARAVDRRGRAHRHRRDLRDDRRLAVQRLRLLLATTRASRPSCRASTRSAARSSTRSTGPRTSTTPGKRVVVIGSGATADDDHPGDGRQDRAHHDAPALAELRPAAARRRTRSPTGCAASSARSAPTRSRAASTSCARP